MKRTLILTTITVMLLSFSSCLTTLYPLFKPEDLTFDDRLLGNWGTGSSGDVVTFERGSQQLFSELPAGLQFLAGKAYLVTSRDNEGEIRQRYYAFLFRIDGNLYMDYYPAATPEIQTYSPFYVAHFVRLHSLYKFKMDNPQTFEIKQFDSGYMSELINNKQVRIRHERNADGGILITASTAELQDYVKKYGDVPGAYEDPGTYKKLN
ncbi:hypothetical protein [uncultured Chitinophaga sp.]|uniref:hypothetical protein n=1 Tax=uncultured Chitinophaga sp. TaxID=339340 RepID=UPI0025DB02D4|nr:hypothetical protein [uncultured Chitinophaga sp.]